MKTDPPPFIPNVVSLHHHCYAICNYKKKGVEQLWIKTTNVLLRKMFSGIARKWKKTANFIGKDRTEMPHPE